MEVSLSGGTPRSSILLGFSMINHPAIGDPPIMETAIWGYDQKNLDEELVVEQLKVTP